MKKNNKGFTLVELIVVLVILAILAAILVPALLGYIDKAKEKRVTNNAEAAFVAAQAILNEEYGKSGTASKATAAQTKAKSATEIKKLTDIDQSFSVELSCGSVTNSKHKGYVITNFYYVQDGDVAHWNPDNGQWKVDTKKQYEPAEGWD